MQTDNGKCWFSCELRQKKECCSPIGEDTNIKRPYPLDVPVLELFLEVKKQHGEYCLTARGVLLDQLQKNGGMFAGAEVNSRILYCPYCGTKL